MTAPFCEQNASSLAARRFRITVEVEILEELVCFGLRALVVLPVVLPRVAIDGLTELLGRERVLIADSVKVRLRLEPAAA